MVKAVEWSSGTLRLIDQTRLPAESVYVDLHTVEDVFDAIKQLKVRGAPAIGVTAAYGLYIAMRNFSGDDRTAFYQQLSKMSDYLASARPTAVNLVWALTHLREQLEASAEQHPPQLVKNLLAYAIELHEDDRQRCERMGENGQSLIPEGARILTHCNTGALATGGIGTALAVIYCADRAGKNISVYANETRPVLQGARLTVWELTQANIPVKLVCDSMGAALMQHKKVDMVILGSDRISADGSVANKIGTYSLAILAKHHGIPFYVVAPLSTVDMNITDGRKIPIEERPCDEIRRVFNQCQITVPDVDCWNPAFDVTPPELVTAIVTEKGVIRPPYVENIAKQMRD